MAAYPRIVAWLGPALAVGLCACQRQDAASAARPATGPATELRRGLGAEPETLDPLRATDNAALAVVGDLYEGLATEAADGSIVPGAAQGWTVSADGRRWTIVLRPALRWSDGEPLTAAHFAASLQAALAPDTSLPNASLLGNVSAVVAEAPDRLRIELSQPVPYLPALLALPLSAPMRADAGAGGVPAVNGPYRLLRWQRGERIELERNAHYHSANDVAIERVTYRPITDLGTELNLFRAGDLDVTSEVPNSRVPWLREHLGRELRVAPYLSTYAYAVNLSRLPAVEARQALAMTLDRERVTSLVTGAGELPAYGWVPPGLARYPAQGFEWRDSPPQRRMAEARALWRDAAQRGRAPSSLTLCTDASANHRRTAVALADQWHTALGVEVRIVELEWNVYLATRATPGECDLVRLGWSADFADAEAFASVFASGHPQNTLGYASRRYDELLARSRAGVDATERARLLGEAERVLLADVPVIPVFHRVAKRLIAPRVQGYQPNPLGHLASRHLSLAP